MVSDLEKYETALFIFPSVKAMTPRLFCASLFPAELRISDRLMENAIPHYSQVLTVCA